MQRPQGHLKKVKQRLDEKHSAKERGRIVRPVFDALKEAKNIGNGFGVLAIAGSLQDKRR